MHITEVYGVDQAYLDKELDSVVLVDVKTGVQVTETALRGPNGDLNPEQTLEQLKKNLS